MSLDGMRINTVPKPIILVCGGRDFAGRGILHLTLDTIWQNYNGIERIVHGDARGADRLARDYAIQFNVPQTPYPAKWAKYGNAAGPIRNQEMLDSEPDIKFVIAFPGGTGTADMIERALAKGIETCHVDETGELHWLSPVRNGEGVL